MFRAHVLETCAEMHGQQNVKISKICRENSSFIKIWQIISILYMQTDMYFLSYLTQFFWNEKWFRQKL